MLADLGDRSSIRRQLDRAWQSFLSGGELEGVSPEIARSWRRARELYGVDPGLRRASLLPSDELSRRREHDETFDVAAPILADFSARLRDKGHVLALLDAGGCVLSIGGDPQIIGRVAEVNFCPGASWCEEATGTNGPGTSLVERRPVEVFASEHFVEAWHAWTCAGAPIIAPGTGEPVGAVDITGPWDTRDPQALVAATAIASLIEERLRGMQNVRDEIIRYAMRAARDSGDALLAIDARGRLLAANDAARRRLALDNGELPPLARERLVATLRARGSPPEDEFYIEWPGASDDRRRVVCSTVSHGQQPVGAVLRITPPAGSRGGRGSGRTRQALATRYAFQDILGQSERLRAAIELAQVATRNDLPVVLHGESGTGKELFAHSIHAASIRARGPFVALNCGAIPAALVEAELFGYEAGTFTGAQRDGRAGKLEEAHGGTLFLDEVSEFSPQAQTALLRVLQESEVVRLGGAPRHVDVRVVAATNKRLCDEVKCGRFRQDLFFRLNVLSITIPALRERLGDVPILARAFLSEAGGRVGRTGLELSDAAMAALACHPWRGNVRELRNVIMRAAAVMTSSRIEPGDLALVELQGFPAGPCATCGLEALERHGSPGKADSAEPEREELVAALDSCEWNIARTATSLGVSRMTLYRRLRKYGITR